MKRVIAWFVRNPVAANLLMMLLVIGGGLSVTQLRQEDLPTVDLGTVLVTVNYLGAAPEEVETGVCVRIEERLAGTHGIDRMESTSGEGTCTVMLELLASADAGQVADDVKTLVDSIITFPVETERPIVQRLMLRSTALEIAVYGHADERTLKALALDVRDDIASMNGVSLVDVLYVRGDEISIEVSEQTLRRHGLTFDQVAAAVRRASLDLPGGAIRTGGGEIRLRTQGQAYRGEDLRDVAVVSRPDGTRVQLHEIADIVDGFQEGITEARFDGYPAAMVTVYKVGDEDVVDIARQVRAYVEAARARMPEGIELRIWYDESEGLRDRIGILLGTAAGGLALVLLLLTLPLEFRLAMWVAAGIPIAMLGALATFAPLGIAISTLSVVAFILVLGIVVDDAIVVGERVYAHERLGKLPQAAAVDGTVEVAAPVIFGVLTTVAAFMPMLFTPGDVGEMFSIIGYIVIICLFFSVVESQLILPAHLAHRRRGAEARAGAFSARWRRLQQSVGASLDRFAHDVYGPALGRVLEWRYMALASGAGVLILAIGAILGGRIEVQFMPAVEGDRIVAQLEMPEGIDVAETARAAQQIEAAALSLRDELDEADSGRPAAIRHSFTSVGQALGGAFGAPQSHTAEVVLSIAPLSERGDISVADLAARWRELTGPVQDSVRLTFASSSLSAGDAISFRLIGRDVAELAGAAAELRAELARFDGVADISDSFRAGKMEARLSLRPEGEQMGLTLDVLARQTRQAFYGEEVQRVQRGAEDVRVMLRYPESERRSLGDLENMRVRLDDGVELPFAAVANVELGRGASSISRVDRHRVVTVSADVDRDAVAPEAVIRRLEAEVLPRVLARYDGIDYSFSGEVRARDTTYGGLIRLLPVALLTIYALLAIPLRSYLQPLVIMSVIPFGAVGAVAGHLVMGWPLIVTSIFGLISLTGVVVNSSLILVDYINRQRRGGAELSAAVRTAGIVRLRPILITSTTTFAGLLPLMSMDSPATSFIVPMAISLGWGVLFATGITLFLVPCLYLILEDIFPARPEAHAGFGSTQGADA